jgi:hypothetical protein
MAGNGMWAVQRALLDEIDLVMNYYFHQGVEDVMNDLHCQSSYLERSPRPDVILRRLHTSGVLFQRSDKPMKQIRNAVSRYVNGTLGICRQCGKKIPTEVLQSTPTAELCPTCLDERSSLLLKRTTVH